MYSLKTGIGGLVDDVFVDFCILDLFLIFSTYYS